jgi:hypothetical protein
VSVFVWAGDDRLLIYDNLWAHLRKLPSLRGRPFPPKSDAKAWALSLQKSKNDNPEICLSGSFYFKDSRDDSPLFQLSLKPLKLERTHRFGRRFGHGRFCEIKISNAAAWRASALFKDESTQSCIRQWLLESSHDFLGRIWKPFYLKGGRTQNGSAKSIGEESEQIPTQSFYFFAISGCDLQTVSVMSILDWMISFELNEKEPALKLFSRISLGNLTQTCIRVSVC